MSTSSDSDGPGNDTRKRKRRSVVQVKGSWTTSDDAKLTRLVQEYGEGNWSSIAVQFPGRIGKQCRERWNNQLRPDIRRDAWTLAEEACLIEAHRQLGNRWADIAKEIPGRTENGVKNHWNATLRKAGKPGLSSRALVKYMSTLPIYQGKMKPTPARRSKHGSAPHSSSHSCADSLTYGNRNQHTMAQVDGADSKPGYVAVAQIRQHRRAAAALARQAIQRLQANANQSDSDFSSEYQPSQQTQAYTQTIMHSNAALAGTQQLPSTAVSRTSSHAAELQLDTGLLCQAQPHIRRRGDPRLGVMRSRSLPVVPQTQAEDDMLLRSLQDIVPADLIEAELSDTGMNAFSFDTEDVAPASGNLLPLPSGSVCNKLATEGGPTSSGQIRTALPVYQGNVKPSDPRLAKHSRPLENSMPQPPSSAAQPAKHDKAGTLSCIPQPPCNAAQPAKHDKAGAACCKEASGRDSGGSGQMGSELQEEVGETGLQAPSSAASTNLPCKLEADSTPQAGGQSSNLIHIQMMPLQSLDSYAGKLKRNGMEVAIYSGSCPLSCLACPQPSRTLQHQVLTKLQNVCGWIRVSSRYQVGSLLIAVRAGPVPHGISGLVIAASARTMPLALQAVKAAVKQIEALNVNDASAQGSGV